MRRTDGTNRAVDLFGAGKDGYQLSPGTVVTANALNALQEEIARVIEGLGVTLNAGSFTQLFDALTVQGRQAVVQPAADLGIIGSTSKPNTHPSSGSNLWKLLAYGKANNDTFIRFYVGAGGTNGDWCITYNAAWDPSSGAQHWVSDQTGQPSSLLMSANAKLHFQRRNAGAGSWTTWPDAADFALTGSATIGVGLTVTGGVDVGVNLNVSGITGSNGGYFTPGSTGGFNFTPNRLHSSPIPLIPINGALLALGEAVPDVSGSLVIFQLRLPEHATGGTLRIAHLQADSSQFTFSLESRVVNYASPALAAWSVIDSDISTTAAGYKVLDLDFSGATADDLTEYRLVVDFPATLSAVQGLRLEDWQDAGPRNTF